MAPANSPGPSPARTCDSMESRHKPTYGAKAWATTGRKHVKLPNWQCSSLRSPRATQRSPPDRSRQCPQAPPQHRSTRPPRAQIPNGSLSNHRPSSREPHGASNNLAHSSPAHGRNNLSNRNSQEPGSHNSPEHGLSSLNNPSNREHGNSLSNPSSREHGSSSVLECLPDGNSHSLECQVSKDL